MINALKGPFPIQIGQAQAARIKIMRQYTSDIFQQTDLQVLRQLLLEFQNYASVELHVVKLKLQNQIKIKQALLINGQTITEMKIDQIDTKVNQLRLIKDSRLENLIDTLESAYKRRMLSNEAQRNVQNQNQNRCLQISAIVVMVVSIIISIIVGRLTQSWGWGLIAFFVIVIVFAVIYYFIKKKQNIVMNAG